MAARVDELAARLRAPSIRERERAIDDLVLLARSTKAAPFVRHAGAAGDLRNLVDELRGLQRRS